MNEQQIRAMIQGEILAANSASRFGISMNSNHAHTGIDAPQISQNNILPGNSVEGSIKFATAQRTYKIGVNFNPTAVFVHGNATGSASGEKFIIVGNAQLGPSLYLQPGPASSLSVVPGGPPQTIIQSCTYFGMDVGNAPHTLVSEQHIANVEYGGNVLARMTITGYDNKNLLVYTDILTSGWVFNLSFTIT